MRKISNPQDGFESMSKAAVREICIQGRRIGPAHRPFVIAEIGINHEGNMQKAMQMVDAAQRVGCECVKFQCHVIADEMIPNEVIPGNAEESIWEIMDRCKLSADEDRALKEYVESKGMIYLCTPFSRVAADRLEAMDVCAYKIGSGECNNDPLVEHIARFGKPVILSTGMNDIESIRPAVEILEQYGIPHALLHCTSMYPTPYDKVRLGGISDLMAAFPHAVVGLSDHSIGNYTCFAGLALGACILEKHFTCDKSWPGPDVPISVDSRELKELIEGADAIGQALGGRQEILAEEQPTIDFAYASVVAIRDIQEGEEFSDQNLWVKRPGTGQVRAAQYKELLGKTAARNIAANTQIEWNDIGSYAEIK